MKKKIGKNPINNPKEVKLKPTKKRLTKAGFAVFWDEGRVAQLEADVASIKADVASIKAGLKAAGERERVVIAEEIALRSLNPEDVTTA